MSRRDYRRWDAILRISDTPTLMREIHLLRKALHNAVALVDPDAFPAWALTQQNRVDFLVANERKAEEAWGIFTKKEARLDDDSTPHGD